MPFMTSDRFEIPVMLFARYAELLGARQVSVSVAAPASLADVVAAVRALPGGQELPVRPLCARNQAHAKLTDHLNPGDEVAILPPLAGG